MSSEIPPQSTSIDRQDAMGWISLGAFMIIAAVTYLTTPNVVPEARAFIRDIKLVEISRNLWWFVPSTNHPVLYNAAERFCYLFGFTQIGVLVLRFARPSSLHGKAETFSGVLFWLGAGYIFSLLSEGRLSWLSFSAALIILFGISIVARGLVVIFGKAHS